MPAGAPAPRALATVSTIGKCQSIQVNLFGNAGRGSQQSIAACARQWMRLGNRSQKDHRSPPLSRIGHSARLAAAGNLLQFAKPRYRMHDGDLFQPARGNRL